MEDTLMKKKFIREGGEWVGLVYDTQRELKAQWEEETHMWVGDCWIYMSEWSPTLDATENSEWLI